MRRRLLPFVLCLLAIPAWSNDPEISWDDMQNIKTHVVADQPVIDFVPALLALNGKTATIQGWMTPFNLGDGTTVTNFLLTGTPGTCPFCLGFGPENFILVTAAEPVPIDITGEFALTGRFTVTAEDATGFYYHLDGARVIGHR